MVSPRLAGSPCYRIRYKTLHRRVSVTELRSLNAARDGDFDVLNLIDTQRFPIMGDAETVLGPTATLADRFAAVASELDGA